MREEEEEKEDRVGVVVACKFRLARVGILGKNLLHWGRYCIVCTYTCTCMSMHGASGGGGLVNLP